MITIGLTGGMGSGKTVISRLFETMGIPVYDSDREAKRIIDASPTIREQLISQFGCEIVQNLSINKKKLSKFIFNNKNNLNFVNSIVHPEVRKDFRQWSDNQRDKIFAAVESAILFESGMYQDTDVTINVSAPLEIRLARIQQRDAIDREAALNRINNQMSDEEREQKADYTIVNDGKQAVLPQVERFFELSKPAMTRSI